MEWLSSRVRATWIPGYGGRNRVESALGQGTTFLFSLPAMETPS
jgi:signal transduction histidine kinase